MERDEGRRNAEHEEQVLRVTAADLRDRPVSNLTGDAMPRAGEVLGAGQAGTGQSTAQTTEWRGTTANAYDGGAQYSGATAYAPESEGQSWGQRGLTAAAMLAPLGLLAIPGVRQSLAQGWQAGSKQVVASTLEAQKAAKRGARGVAKTVESGKQNVAETVKDSKQGLVATWLSGKREVSDKVEDLREAREDQQRRERELEAKRWERRVSAVERVERDVEKWADRQRGRSTLKPFLFGALLSGGLALLFTPKAGEQLRAQLRETLGRWQGQATDLAGQAKQQAGTLQQQAQGLAGQVKDQAQQVVGQAKEGAVTLKDQTQQATGQMKQQAGAAQGQTQQATGTPSLQSSTPPRTPSPAATAPTVNPAAGSQLGAQTGAAAGTAPAATAQRPPTPTTGMPQQSSAALAYAGKIKEHMAIVGLKGEPVGTVDHLDASDTIKVTKDAEGKHHWIPLKWVAKVDDRVHLNRAGQQAQREWLSAPPQGR